MKTRKSRLYTFFFRCWWTVFVILFCYGFYLHAMHKKRVLYIDLKDKAEHLEASFASAAAQRESFCIQIQSQSDPAWIELLIKKHLGMVPYGQTKVYFDNQ